MATLDLAIALQVSDFDGLKLHRILEATSCNVDNGCRRLCRLHRSATALANATNARCRTASSRAVKQTIRIMWTLRIYHVMPKFNDVNVVTHHDRQTGFAAKCRFHR
jgi:hypothetical protein